MIRRRKTLVVRTFGTAAACYALSVPAACTSSNDLPPVPEPVFDASSDDASIDAPDDADVDSTTASDASSEGAPADGGAVAVLAQTSMTFPGAPCGMAGAPSNLTVMNTGAGALAVSAATVGGAFAVSPSLLTVPAGQSGVLTVTPNVPSTAAAGATITGALTLFTNVPGQSNMTVPLTATASGAALEYASTTSQGFAFPASAVGSPTTLTVTVVNDGNAAATFDFGAPSSSLFTLQQPNDGGGAMIAAGASLQLTATFAARDTNPAMATSAITASAGASCTGLQTLSFTGLGATGNVTGWPQALDFGAALCGGDAPGDQSFELVNSGAVDAHVTSLSISGGAVFTSSTTTGTPIFAHGGKTKVTVSAPPVPTSAPTIPVSASLTITTDADTIQHIVTLTEEPTGGVLSFDTGSTFGNFGQVTLLGEATQSFSVVNSGNASVDVVLTPSPSGVFAVSSPTFTIGAGGSQGEMATFAPITGGGTSGTIAVSAMGSLCGALPASLAISGNAVGGAPTIEPSSLTFAATCGAGAPARQTFIVRNDGNADFTWSMGGLSGPGAAQYTLTPTPAPGLLIPGASATVVVDAAAIPSPATNPGPAAYAATFTIDTDVPLDPPHIVTLGETPIGDQLTLSTSGPLRYGQVPIQSSIEQGVVVTNNANAGSPPASVSFALGGSGAAAFASQASLANIAPGTASAPDPVTFSPSAPQAYSATLGLATTDPVCTPLPQAITLNGTGTQGKVLVSSTSLTLGTDPNDSQGMVNCGATGLAHQVTISNVGNQAFNVTNVALGKGSASPFMLSGAASETPVAVPIGGTISLTIAPSPIPANVQNPGDPSAFADTLSITTNADGDAPHAIALVMQARGAVIAATPVITTWNFGQISFGSIGTFTNSIQNTGNAPVTVGLSGLATTGIFGLANNPTTVPGGGITSVVGQFAPPSSNGQWSDTGVLTVTATEALCEPLPSQWVQPAVNVSGTSNSNPAISIAGSLTFPNTSCGSPSPAAMAITLTNNTNAAYPFTASFNSGQYYCLDGCAGDAGAGALSGTLAANGSSQVVVAPRTITPGSGVIPGSAPYADDLILRIATNPPTQFTVPIAWALDGAVLTLPQGGGPHTDGLGHFFYLADTTSGYPLPMLNSGTATASVAFAVQPAGLFSLTPSGAINVIPGIGANPQFVGPVSTPVCPATSSGTATFVYSGPVCQPFPFASIPVQACSGSLTQ